MDKKKVLVTGGTGFIGKHLIQLLQNEGYVVSVLSREIPKETNGIAYFLWNTEQQTIDDNALKQADFVIHLAGENIASQPWTAARKKAILDSREKSTQLLYSSLVKTNSTLEAFISASGVGIYGAYTDEVVCTENTPAANDFLGMVCQKWEAATQQIQALGIRTVQIRTGLVLGKNDGILNAILPIFRWRLGSVLGSGKQYMPWIHQQDLCRIYLHALKKTDMQGPYNAAVNDGTTNAIFTKTLAKILGYRIFLPPVPAFILRFFLGEKAQLVLTGRRIASEKIEKTGFSFHYTQLESALRNCLSK